MDRNLDKLFTAKQFWDGEPIDKALNMGLHFYAKFNYESLHREAMIISGNRPYEEVRMSQIGQTLSEAVGRLSMSLKDPREGGKSALFYYGIPKSSGFSTPEGNLDKWLMSRNAIYGTMSDGKVRLEMRHSKYITKPLISTQKDTFKEAYDTLDSLKINEWLFE